MCIFNLVYLIVFLIKLLEVGFWTRHGAEVHFISPIQSSLYEEGSRLSRRVNMYGKSALQASGYMRLYVFVYLTNFCIFWISYYCYHFMFCYWHYFHYHNCYYRHVYHSHFSLSFNTVIITIIFCHYYVYHYCCCHHFYLNWPCHS